MKSMKPGVYVYVMSRCTHSKSGWKLQLCSAQIRCLPAIQFDLSACRPNVGRGRVMGLDSNRFYLLDQARAVRVSEGLDFVLRTASPKLLSEEKIVMHAFVVPALAKAQGQPPSITGERHRIPSADRPCHPITVGHARAATYGCSDVTVLFRSRSI